MTGDGEVDLPGVAPETGISPSRPAVDRTLLLIAIVWAIVFSAMYKSPPIYHLQSIPEADTTLDPNEAPWWELTVLPRVGETLARQIVAQRKQTPFRCLADLQRVRGIGPKTAQRAARFLHFPANDSINKRTDAPALPTNPR